MEWTYKNKPVKKPPEKSIGFIYCITNRLNGRKYIGKKFIFSHRTKKISGRKNRKHTIKESDWRNYYGSNEFLIKDVSEFGEEYFTREILNFYNTKKEVSYAETEEQFRCDVLRAKLKDGEPAFYNRNILGKYFPINVK